VTNVAQLVNQADPPVQVKKVIEAAAILLGLAPVKSTKGRQFMVVSHRAAQEIARDPNFLTRLVNHTNARQHITDDGVQALTVGARLLLRGCLRSHSV
jgi:hypothetical protein